MWTRLTYFIQSNRHLGPWFVVGCQVNNLAQCLVTGTGMLETGNWQALLRCRIIISTRQRRSSKAHNFNTPGARGTSCKMMRTAPRLVFNTAAGAASTSGGHFANSATFRRPSPKVRVLPEVCKVGRRRLSNTISPFSPPVKKCVVYMP